MEDEDCKIRVILEKMRSLMEAGEIEVDAKKHQKLLDILRLLSLFGSLKRQYKDLGKQKEELLNEMPGIETEIEKLRSAIESEEHEIIMLRRELQSKNSAIAADAQQLEELKQELVNSMSEILGKTVIVN